MHVSKPFLIMQLRPEDEASDNEFQAFLKYDGLEEHQVQRIRIEKAGIPKLLLDDYSAIIVGGSPFDISTPAANKSPIQNKIESGFTHSVYWVAKERKLSQMCSFCYQHNSYYKQYKQT